VSRKEPNFDWQAPPFTAPEDERLAWIEGQIQEGEGWLSNQRAYQDLPRNIQIFDAVFRDNTKSTLLSNNLKYNIKKFVETVSDVREIGSYTSDAKQWKPFAGMINKIAKGIYIESQFPRQIRKVLQYATVMGRGYLWPKCKVGHYGYGERRIIFEPLGPIDVLPVQVPSSADTQASYVVTVFEYMPIAEAHGKFPLFQSQLQPVADATYNSRVQARRLDYAEKFRTGGSQSRNWGSLYCEIRYTFIRDIRKNIPLKNKRGAELPMGDVDTSWFYKVPYVGQDILGGFRDGKRVIRKATLEDCRIYPFLRLMISANGVDRPMYDGPAQDWHGEIPPVQYDVDDWAWEGMGRSLISDVGSIVQTKRKLERKMDQVIDTTLNPPIGYDRTANQGPKMENFDIFASDQRVGTEGEPKKIVQSVLPDEVRVVSEHFKFWELLDKMELTQLGVNDLGSLANLKMNISGDQLDKGIEAIGPIAKGIAGGMEAANAKVAYQLPYLIIQWLDTRRIISYIGPDNIVPELFDMDPNSIIPSHMPEEYVLSEKGHYILPMTGEGPDLRATDSAYSLLERSRRLTTNIRLISIPETLLRITQKDEQLKLMTLKKQGAPIGWVDIMPKLGVENFGEVKGNTVLERYINEEIEMLKLKVEEAKLAAAAGLEGAGPGQGKGGGRPNSNRKKPDTYQKGGAGGQPRAGVKTS
jgi:hypothetical protein